MLLFFSGAKVMKIIEMAKNDSKNWGIMHSVGAKMR